MYGSGQALPPSQPTRHWVVIGLRVLLTVLPIISLSLLAWVSMLRLAVLGKRSLDWLMLAVAAGLAIVGFTCFGFSHDDNDWQANTGATLLLVCMFGSAVYFLVADILRVRRDSHPAWPAAPVYAQPNPYVTGLGIPGAPGPADRRPQQGYPTPQPYAAPAPIPGRTPPPPAAPPSAPTPPRAPRISQVRAELDELSDYLRKEEGR